MNSADGTQLSAAAATLTLSRPRSTSEASSASRSASSCGVSVSITAKRVASAKEAFDVGGETVERSDRSKLLERAGDREQFQRAAGRRRIDHCVAVLQRGPAGDNAQALEHQERFQPRQRGTDVAEGAALEHPARDGFDWHYPFDERFELGACAERDGFQVGDRVKPWGRVRAIARAGFVTIVRRDPEHPRRPHPLVQIDQRRGPPPRQRERQRRGHRTFAGAALAGDQD